MSEFTVKIDQPNLSPGTPVELPPVGVMKNGSSAKFELSNEQAKYLANAYGVTVKTHDGKEVKPGTFETAPVIANIVVTEEPAAEPVKGGDK